MSARYQLRERGVWDYLTNALVLPGTPEWDAYQSRVAAGMLPDPAPRISVEDVRRERMALVNVRRNAAASAGFTFGGRRYDSDARSLANIAARVAQMAVPEGFTWRTADNVDVPMSTGDMASLGDAAVAHTDVCYRHSWALKRDIAAAVDPSKVDIDSGWPT